MEKLFFSSWESIYRILIVGVFSYAGLVIMLRMLGNRTLSQLNAFDFVVTVALGSTLASVILSKDISLADGLLALGLLIVLQLAISKAATKSKPFRTMIKTEPYLLFFNGRSLPKALSRHRVSEDDIRQIVRLNGIDDLQEVDAIILESNGQFSVLRKAGKSGSSALENVVAPENWHKGDDRTGMPS